MTQTELLTPKTRSHERRLPRGSVGIGRTIPKGERQRQPHRPEAC